MSDLWSLFASTSIGVLTTLKRDGRPQLSNVVHVWDAETRVLLISVTDDRAKTRNLRRDPRAGFYVTSPDGGAYAVGEGIAELGPVTTSPDDEVADQLVEYYRSLQGEHPDWAEYRAAMVSERRLLLRLPLTRVYGRGPEAG